MKSSSLLNLCSKVLIPLSRFVGIILSILAKFFEIKMENLVFRISKIPALSDLKKKTFLEDLILQFQYEFLFF